MEDIIKQLVKFRDDRNWKQFHTPKNLAKSVMIEAAELLEIFQWDEKENDIEHISEEISDIVSYCLLLCEHYNLDIKEIMNNKIKLNIEKYPIEKSFGVSTKHNKL